MKPTHTIGPCELYNADCFDVDVKHDMLFTSPPYNCGKDYGENSDNLKIDIFIDFLRESIFVRENRVSVVNVGQYVGSRKNRVLFRNILMYASNGDLIDEVIWDKGPANGAAWGNYPQQPKNPSPA